MSKSRYQTGLRVRRQVLGDSYVDHSLASITSLDANFQRLVTETAWGSVWARPQLDLRTRSLITIAILAALGRTEELALHLRASRNAGAEPSEISEALLHVAVYAGIPAANAAFRLAKAEFSSEADGQKPGPPEDMRR